MADFDISAPLLAAQKHRLLQEQEMAARNSRFRDQRVNELAQMENLNPIQLQELAVYDPSAAGVLSTLNQRATQQRMDNLAMTVSQAKTLLDNNNYRGLVQLAASSMQDIPEAAQVMEALAVGDLDTTKQLIDGTYQQMVGVGLIKPAGSKAGSQSSLQVPLRLDALREQLRNETDPQKRAIIEEQIETQKLMIKATPQEELDRATNIEKMKFGFQELGGRRKTMGEDIVSTTDRLRKTKFNLQAAMKASKDANTGYWGGAKIFLSKVFPDMVDTTDEGQLDSALTGFALDNLQSFKGPTTDFEYRIAESITGKLTDAKTTIGGKLNLLDLATFLDEKQNDQRREFMRSKDADPIDFQFNGSQDYKGFTLNEISKVAIDNNLSIDQTIEFLKKQEKKTKPAAGTIRIIRGQ